MDLDPKGVQALVDSLNMGAGPETALRAYFKAANNGWRDIETAPRNGTPIIGAWQCLNKTWDMNVVIFMEGLWLTYYMDATHNPTHWMPLREPPEGDT